MIPSTRPTLPDMAPMDIEAIERATLAAVPPQRQDTWHEWLLAFDDGTVGRCHSAVPLRHAPPRAGSLEHIATRYAQAGLDTIIRLPERAAFDAFRGELQTHGYSRSKPTAVQVAALGPVTTRDAIQVQLADAPGPGWERVFLGEGFDPVDGASRLAILRRGRDSLFASVLEGDQVVAVGAACLHGAWCGVHGMRTLPAFRGRGHASAILAAFAQMAQARGIPRWFLQVDEDNAAARRLYERWGFETAWTYAYWRLRDVR